MIGLAQPQALKIAPYRNLRQSGEVFQSDGPQLILSGDIPDRPAQWTDLGTNWTHLSLHKTEHKECLFALDYVPKIPGTNVVRAQAIAFDHGQAPSQFSPIRDGKSTGLPPAIPLLKMRQQAIGWLTQIHNCR